MGFSAFPGGMLLQGPISDSLPSDGGGGISGGIFGAIDTFLAKDLPVILNQGPSTAAAPPPRPIPTAPAAKPFPWQQALLLAAVAALVIGLILVFTRR